MIPLLFVLLPVLGQEVRYEASHSAMGSKFTIVAYGASEGHLAAAAEQAFAEIVRLDGLLSNYKPTSELSRVNQKAAQSPMRVTPEFFRFLEVSDDFRRRTEGAFDITLGKGTITLDAAAGTVKLSGPAVKLDPGGIGKGWAVDRAAEILKDAGIRSALVSFGDSSIFAIGAPPGQAGWKIMVRSPQAKEKSVLEVVLKDETVSTSGTYEKGQHIVDPKTGAPPRGVLSASAFAPTATESDAITKCFFVLGRQGALRYLKQNPKVRAFLCDPECSWVQ